MITVLVAGTAAAGDTLELDADETHHLRVRRLSETRVQVRDGAGLVGEGVVTVRGERVVVTVERAETIAPPPALVLAVGAGDRERFGMLAEKAAEIGVTQLVPLDTARARSVAGRVRDDHLRRLRRRTLEALKQSGAAWAPEIRDTVSLEQFIQALSGAVGSDRQATSDVRWLADGEGEPPPSSLSPTQPAIVLIGPEGGLTPEERDAVVAGGFVPVCLGPHVLRFETAAIAAAVTINVARRRGAR